MVPAPSTFGGAVIPKFNTPSVLPVDLDQQVVAEYEKQPAVTAFSRKPIPPETARTLGVVSWTRAQRRVQQRLWEAEHDLA